MGLLMIILVVFFLAACGAVMLVKDLLAGAFSCESNESDSKQESYDGVYGIPMPGDELNCGAKG